MHKQLLKVANDDQLREFVNDALSMLKETHPDTYDTLEMHLYKEVYGCHFSDWLLAKAVKNMLNEDGTTGAHWTVEQTNSVAKNNNIVFTKFNEYDWNYVMNMMYSDYYNIFSNDTNTYIKLSKNFLDDKDAPEGKALLYYLTMSKN